MPAIYWQLMQSSGYLNVTGQIETDAGKRPSVTNFSSQWYSGTFGSGSYNTAGAGTTIRNFLNSARSNGCIPWLDWYSSLSGSDTAFSLKSIYIDGLHDAFLTQFATDIAAWGHPLFIRFDGEMNGSWRTTYYERNGFGAAGRQNAAGDFVLMWRHVHDIMAPIAPNITWGWCPNQQPTSPVVSYASIFPGAAYADWMGFDAYNWAGSQPGGGKTFPWATFTQILRGGTAGLGDSWTELTALDPNMPCFLGEHGCDTREGTDTNASAGTTAVWNGQKKADWYTDELNVQLPGNGTTDFRRLRMISYFNVTDSGANPPVSGGFVSTNGDWPIEDPTVASGKAGGGAPQAAWQAPTGINSSYFVRGGQFLLPSGLNKVYPYEGTPQISRFDNAILHTAQGKLQGFWKTNETTGTVAADSSGNARNGTYTGGFTLGQPKIALGVPTFDPSVLFDGTTGYVTVPNNAGFWIPNTGKLTAVGIFEMVALPASGSVMVLSVGGDGNGRGWEITVSSTGVFRATQRNLAASVYSDTTTAAGVVAAGTPMFFAWSIDTTLAGSPSGAPFAHLYYGPLGGTLVTNKVSVDTTTLSPLPATGTGTLNIARLGNSTGFANVVVQRAAVYSDAISQVSAQELFTMANTRTNKPRSFAA